MTFGALEFSVFAVKRVSSELSMIEFFFINGNRIVFAAFVFGMALAAALGVETVKSFFILDKGFEFFVAGQALAVRNPFPSVMTFEAVFFLEFLMACDQRARG